MSRTNPIIGAATLALAAGNAASTPQSKVEFDPQFGKAIQKIAMQLVARPDTNSPALRGLYETAINRAVAITGGKSSQQQALVIPNQPENVFVIDVHARSFSVIPLKTPYGTLEPDMDNAYIYTTPTVSNTRTPDQAISNNMEAIKLYNEANKPNFSIPFQPSPYNQNATTLTSDRVVQPAKSAAR